MASQHTHTHTQRTQLASTTPGQLAAVPWLKPEALEAAGGRVEARLRGIAQQVLCHVTQPIGAVLGAQGGQAAALAPQRALQPDWPVGPSYRRGRKFVLCAPVCVREHNGRTRE